MYQIRSLKSQWQSRQNDVPALGYVQYSIDTQKDSHKETADKKVLENKYYTIEVEENGSLTIVDKANNVTIQKSGNLSRKW